MGMNGNAQRTHRTVTSEIASTLERVVDATGQRFARLEQRLADTEKLLRAKLDDERTHRLKLADEQRAYVDRADAQATAKLCAFTGRTFWQRLKWLLRGDVA